MSAYELAVKEEKAKWPEGRPFTPHDEAFKKLLQTFFAEFIELFFPELDKLLDHRHTRFLMQELLVDIVGEEKRTLDLLLETRYLELDAYILIHIEPQSYRENDFHERMFIYFSRLFERHRKEYKLIIPIAVFTADEVREEKNTLEMSTPQQPILRFEFMKVEMRKQPWRQFIDSGNPVAAALLAKMGYTKGEKREIRLAYLRMILRLQGKLDDARMALIMSVADQYFNADPEEDKRLLEELKEQYPEEGESLMELMPAWSRLGYEKGLEKGLEKGIEQGIEKTALNMLREGIEASLVAKVTGLSAEQVAKLEKTSELYKTN
ncbi:Rpn family recombination-promoting nuclease/putative transposase [Paenibacillus macerans]|uniref:Rpn family recombination-promoting nuclease/putative transposase n=1 Tax=Paenibacillus macerans TaxID=44252 RepID=UPI002DB70938|nr:Rpn family recombination-promoting nuclease/putative transposase [Paenibacillus macerans]MEC0332527.1 Rpn family recombination-promoting nuclease/putative transposase [Paenibacillus macerans]